MFPLHVKEFQEKLCVGFRPWQRSLQFWVRAVDIYTGYKVLQARVNFVKNADRRDAMWEEQHEIAADKIYSMCIDLGGFFLKVAQIIGKPDLAPAAWVKRLVTLCDQAPATQFNAIKDVLEEELGQNIDDIFENFDVNPLGSASIAQVHRARLKGTKGDVAVKIQHPGVQDLMMTDIHNMQAFALFLQKTDIDFDLYSVTKEIEKQIGYEFDFSREADAMEKILHYLHANNKKSPVQVPRVVRNMVSRKVLVMEYIDGIPILKLGDEMAKRGINPVGKVAVAAKQNILKSLTLAYGQMILRSGFFHADPHPGNILICRGSQVALLDYGQVKELPEKLRLGYANLVLAIADNDPVKAIQSYRELGINTLTKCEDEQKEMLKLARIMFDTKLPPGVKMLQPFSEESSVKKIGVQAFPEELFSVLRTIQLLRGLSVGMGINYSCAEQWRPIAEEALCAAGRLTDVKETRRRGLIKRIFSSFFSHDPLDEKRKYPASFAGLPILEDATAAIWFPIFCEESGEFKRLRRTSSFGETADNSTITRTSSMSSLNSVSRPQFRDHISVYNQRYLAAEAVEAAATAIIGAEDAITGNEEINGDGMKLVQQLISCAEAVACRDKSHASLLLSELRANALVFGTSFQRVASCFVQGLADRLALVQPLGTVGYIAPKMNVVSKKRVEALHLVYEICPHIQFGHFVANSSILEAFEGESLVHVVDLGMTLGLPHGHQWHSLINSLAERPGAPPSLRITAVGLCVDKFRVIGEELEAYAAGLGLNLEFSVVQSHLENLKPKDIRMLPGEVLVVNSILQLHCVVKESRGALNSVLQVIHELSPKVLVLVEQDSGHNGPFFLGRFMEALHYYSAIFDSLDAMLPKYNTKRAKMEQFYFAEEIKNIVSCEGPARVERHERVDQWRRRMSRAGFQPMGSKLLGHAKQWLSSISACEGFTIVEEKGCLVLGWKSKPIVAASCWKC